MHSEESLKTVRQLASIFGEQRALSGDVVQELNLPIDDLDALCTMVELALYWFADVATERERTNIMTMGAMASAGVPNTILRSAQNLNNLQSTRKSLEGDRMSRELDEQRRTLDRLDAVDPEARWEAKSHDR